MDDKSSFVVYTDIKEIIDDLDDAETAALFRGMVDYQLTGKPPKFKGSLKYIFIPIRQQMDRNNEKWEKIKEKRAVAGRIGGQKTAEKRTKQNVANQANATFVKQNKQKVANQAVTVTVTDTVNVNGTVTVSDSDATSLSSELVSYLNEKTGSTYEATDTIKERVASLIESGYSPEQLRTVIDKKCSEWLNDDKMRTYLRPSTLFGDKFSEYLAAPITLAQEREQDTERKRKSLASELEQKRDTLGVLKASLDEIPRGTRMDERRVLKDQIAALEDSIDLIERRLS